VATIGKECLYCLVGVASIQLDGGESAKRYRCLTEESQEGNGEPSMAYSLGLPSWFVDTNKAKLHSGESYICIEGGQAVRTSFGKPDYVVIPSSADIYFINGYARRSRILQTSGTKSVLVIRVTAPSSTLNATAAELKNAVFGIGAQTVNTASQFSACSTGKLQIIPAVLPGNSLISGGVMGISLPESVSGKNVLSLENDMTAIAQAALGVNLKKTFSHVIWCLPGNTTWSDGSKWIAYAYNPGQFSYYNNSKHNHFSSRKVMRTF
jgi:hypothetical protein